MRRLLLLPLGLCAACGTTDFAGNYTVGLTNRDNACMFSNWSVGAMTSGIQFTITQSGGHLTGTVGGPIQIYADLIAGTNVFSGQASGSQFTLTLPGTLPLKTGQCAYFISSTIQGNLAGDVLTGGVNYTASTNNSQDCGTLTNCVSTQEFNGTRPPS